MKNTERINTVKGSGKSSQKIKRVVESAGSFELKKSKSWFDLLGKEDKEWLECLKREIISGKHAHMSMTAIALAVSRELSVKVGSRPFREWIRKQ